jgi:hypothetical protein
MKDKRMQQTTTNDSNHAPERKPFVAPALRQQSALTHLTAERTFTFSSGS